MKPANPRVVVVGGANIDLKARTDGPHRPATSNPGRLTASPGGVGRNIAENLARLGTDVALVAAIGPDGFGDQLRSATAAAGVDVDGLVSSTRPTGTYLAVLDNRGDLVTGVADMSATDHLAAGDVDESRIADCTLLVLDGNLPRPVLAHLLKLAADWGLPVVIDPVSVAKATRLAPLLGAATPVFAITPNLDELGALTGLDRPDEAAAVRQLHERGVALVWVRHGRAGSRLYRADQPPIEVSAVELGIVEVTGAGDSLTAGFVHALVGGRSPAEAARFGAVVAGLTVAVGETVRHDLTAELVERELKRELKGRR